MMFYDERLTSFEARQISKSSISRKKKHCDDIAASLILEGFLLCQFKQIVHPTPFILSFPLLPPIFSF